MLPLLLALACASTPESPAPSEAPPPEAGSPEGVNEPAPPVQVTELAAGRLDLGLRLLAASGGGDDLALSPSGPGHLLTLVWAGARGETAAQLAGLLGIPGGAEGVHEAAAALRARSGQGAEGVALQATTLAWLHEGLALEPAFAHLTRATYGASFTPVDFVADAEAARAAVNARVAEATEGQIPALLSSLDPDTRLLLVDAARFKGTWARPFDPAATAAGPFTLASGEVVEVPTMARTDTWDHAHLSGVQVLRLPYGDGRLSMLLVLPDDPAALPGLEGKLDADALDALTGALRPRRVALRLPRFSARSRVSLAPLLAGLGAPLPFSAQADLSGIAPSLFIGAVEQEVVVEVDEAGTEAAAATAVGIELTSMPPELAFDRPFLFFIQDSETREVLFLGRVADPR